MTAGFDDLDVYFSEFAVDCVKPDTSVVKVLFDEADQEFLGGMVVSAKFKARGKTSEVGSLKSGELVQISGVDYVVRKAKKVGDGAMTDVYLDDEGLND